MINLVGILLVASPDLVPGALRLAAVIRPRWRQIENQIRGLLRLPPHGITYDDAATVGMRIRIAAAGEVDFDPNAPLEDQVAFLLRRNRESQREMNALAQRVTAIEEWEPGRRAELRAYLEDHVARQLEAAREAYRIARIFGTFVLVLGLAVTTWAELA